MAVHAEIQKKLNIVNVAFTQSGAVATITGNLNHRQLDDLLDAAYTTQHQAIVTAGVLTIAPR
jgi:uncharacterized protein YfkK (UPF0435 family)